MPRSSNTSFPGRLLAEAVRLREADGASPIHDPAVADEARAAGGDFESRIVRRARTLGAGSALDTGLDQVRTAALAVSLLVALAAAAIGLGAARAALGTSGSEPVNFFLVLLGLLGVQALLLAAWIAILLIRPHMLAGGSLGGFALALGRRVSSWLHRGPDQVTAMQALATVMARSPFGTWSLSAVTHLVWIAFNVGAIVMIVILLSARQYTFVWETTILSERTYVPLTRAIAAAPKAVGFAVPDRQQIIDSRTGRDGAAPAADDAGRSEAWSGLLIGSMVLYGLGPRLLLLGLSLSLRRRARRRYRLDTTLPGFRRLRPSLMPRTQSLGIVDPAEPASAISAAVPRAEPATERPAGDPAIIGYEIAVPRCAWPPPLPGLSWSDLGLVDDGPGRAAVLKRLRDGELEPRTVVVVCELTTTPDRGVQRFLRDVASCVSRPVTLVLTAGHRLRDRSGPESVAPRVDDWRVMASEAGVDGDRQLELDLDHLTDRSRAGLLELLAADGDGGPEAPAVGRRIDGAFDLIDEHASAWTGSPDHPAQSKLHVALAKLYRDDAGSWAQRLHLNLPTSLSGQEVASRLGDGARGIVSMLPDRLRRSPRWLAAGAVTGALGCVAAATLISPVAIGALPIWSGIGAAVAAVVQPGGKAAADGDHAGEDDSEHGRADAVRAAALFAVLLEVQGRDEASISRILEETFGDDADGAGGPDGPGGAQDIADVAGWLAERAHRLDLALARESRT